MNKTFNLLFLIKKSKIKANGTVPLFEVSRIRNNSNYKNILPTLQKKTGTVFRKNTYASPLVPDLTAATANSYKN